MNRTLNRRGRRLAVWLVCVGLFGAGAHQVQTQAARTFTVRLTPLPVDGPPMMATIAGLGEATATLAGTRLTIEGSFAGLVSPATTMKLHRGARGIRGPSIVDLPAPPNAVSGKFSAAVDLTPSQVEDLDQKRLYLQLSSEKAPDGNLWGWLLPREHK